MGDELVGTVERRLARTSIPTATTSDGVPEHILKMKQENPSQVSLMQWKPIKEFEMADAKKLTSVAMWIKNEFVGLMQNNKDSDMNFRLRMFDSCPHIGKFATTYPKFFTQLTTRAVVLHPPFLTALMFQLHVLEQVQMGHISDDHAKSMIAERTMTEMLSEAVRQGKVDPSDIPKAENEAVHDQNITPSKEHTTSGI